MVRPIERRFGNDPHFGGTTIPIISKIGEEIILIISKITAMRTDQDSGHTIETYKNTRRRNDPLFQLTEDIRRRFRVALRRGCKNGSAVKDLGCSIEEFKNHIEARFLPGMTWTNRSEWHLDHIIPLSLFDLQDRNQLVVALNYRNYQPLWAKDNMRKNATLDPSHEPLLYEIIDAVHQVN